MNHFANLKILKSKQAIYQSEFGFLSAPIA